MDADVGFLTRPVEVYPEGWFTMNRNVVAGPGRGCSLLSDSSVPSIADVPDLLSSIGPLAYSISQNTPPPSLIATTPPSPLPLNLHRPWRSEVYPTSDVPPPSRAVVWRIPFDSLEWINDFGRHVTAFITVPESDSVCSWPGTVHHGLLSMLFHEIAQRCCTEGVWTTMNVRYMGSLSPGDTAVLTARTLRRSAQQIWVSCTINKSGQVVASAEAIFSTPLDMPWTTVDADDFH